MIPTKIFFTKGVGRHREKLAAFEIALRDAGIQHCNLVNVSSIFPPHCKIVSRKEGEKLLKPGQITFVVMARSETNEPNRLLAASIGLALPADPTAYGYLSEHHGFGQKERVAGDYAEDLAAEMLASTLGVEFNPDKSYDELRETWKISDKIVKTRNITQSAVADKDGKWTSVIAAAVFVFDDSTSSKTVEKREVPDIDPNGN
ncbi:pyruvoyl-dependent arginine decarboxylase [candidate division KSB1 bacterium]